MTGAPIERRNYRAEGMLLLLTFVWGSTFPAIKACLEYASPLVFVACRFGVAALFFCIAFPRQLRSIPGQTWRDGALLGFLMGMAFMTQTMGLGGTSASRSGFLTALYVPFTPVLQILAGRGVPRAGLLISAGIVLVGLYCMASPEGQTPVGYFAMFTSSFNAGDWWTMLCAFLFALYMIVMDALSGRHDALQLTFVQLLVCGAIAAGAAPMLELPRFEPTTPLLVGLSYLALFASLLAIFIQTRYQRETTPARAALIFAMEAVFSAMLAALFLGEWLSTWEVVGGMLIIAGLLFSELSGREQLQQADAI